MKSKNKIHIKFSEIKLRTYSHSFDVGVLFSDYPEKIDMHLSVKIREQETFYLYNNNFKGTIKTLCDKCNDPLKLSLSFKDDGVIKPNILETDTPIINFTSQSIDMDKYLYDIIITHIPMKKVHNTGECNKEIIENINLTTPTFNKNVWVIKQS